MSFHLPLDGEAGPSRPLTEARLLARLGPTAVVTSGIHHQTEEDLRGEQRWCSSESRDGFTIHRVWGLRDHRRSLWRRSAHYIAVSVLSFWAALTRAGPVDVVICGSHPTTLLPLAWLAARLKGARFVIDERDLYPETAIALGVMKDGPLARSIAAAVRWLRGQADAVLAATPGIARRIVADGVAGERVKLLLNGDAFLAMDAAQLETGRRWMRAQRRRLDADCVAIYAGGLGRANDVDTLISAMALLRDERIALIVAGSGERLDAYRARCRELGLKRVMFAGAVPRSEARAWIAAADLGVHVYPDHPLFEMALPSKVFDYMALGTAIVFAGVGDTAALIDEAGAGRHVAPGDAAGLAAAIAALARDEEARRRLGRDGADWFARHIDADSAARTVAAACGIDALPLAVEGGEEAI